MIYYLCFASFSLTMVYMAIKDIKTHLIPKPVHIILFGIGFIKLLSTGPPDQIFDNLLYALAGMVLSFVPMLLIAVIKRGNKIRLGGGDIKLSASAGFALAQPGLTILNPGAYWAITASLIFFLIGWLFLKKFHKRDVCVPMAFGPFFAAAGIGTYFLQLIWRTIL